MSSKVPPNTNSFKLFKAYADSIGVSTDDLASATTAACYETLIRGCIEGTMSLRGETTIGARRALVMGGVIIHGMKAGFKSLIINEDRFDYLIGIRGRIK